MISKKYLFIVTYIST